MLAILCSWIVITFVFLAFGGMLVDVVNRILKKFYTPSFFDAFWLGLCVVGTIASILSIFIPLNIYVLCSFLFATFLYFILRKRSLIKLSDDLFQSLKEVPRWLKCGLVLFIVIILVYSLNIFPFYDMGLYHLQSMIWTEKYSVIPGLGNLHGRLAFNSNSLLLNTLFSYHPDYYFIFFPLNSLCLTIFILWALIKISKLKSVISEIITYVFILILIFFFRTDISSTSTDLISNVLVIRVLFSVLTIRSNHFHLFAIGLISVFCVTLKLSAGPIGLLAILVLICFFRAKEYKLSGLFLLFCAIIIAPWLIRFIILSGYLIYPLSSIDLFEFDWKMDELELLKEKYAAYAWARVPRLSADAVLSMSFTQWFPQWIHYQTPLAIGFYILSLISPLIMCIYYILSKNRNPFIYIVWIIAIAGAVFAFSTAPDIRFSIGFVVSSGFLPILLICLHFSNGLNLKNLRYVVLFVGSIILLGYSIRQLKFHKAYTISYRSYLLKPQSLRYTIATALMMKDITHAEFEEINIDGTALYLPKKTDQCFDQCLPCTPYFDGRLEMRGESLQDGFRIKQE